MSGFRLIAATVVFGVLGACSAPEMVTRNSATDALPTELPTAQWHVVDVRVTAPRNLVTTEADVYYLQADLVWHVYV